VIERGGAAETRAHFTRVADSRVRLSDLQAFNFTHMQGFVFLLMAVALIRSCSLATMDPGSIFAVLGYVMMFATGLAVMPSLAQQLNRLKDIGERLRLPAEA